jgi:hypothetical protein
MSKIIKGVKADSIDEMDAENLSHEANLAAMYDRPFKIWHLACAEANKRIRALRKEMEAKESARIINQRMADSALQAAEARAEKAEAGRDKMLEEARQNFVKVKELEARLAPPPAPAKKRRMKGPKNHIGAHTGEHDEMYGCYLGTPCIPVDDKSAHICPCIVPGCDIQGGHAHSGKPAPSATVPPEGYRLLVEGEEIRQGDIVWAYDIGPWQATYDERDLGHCWHPVRDGTGKFPFARKIEPAPEGNPKEGIIVYSVNKKEYWRTVDGTVREMHEGGSISILRDIAARLERSAKHDG